MKKTFALIAAASLLVPPRLRAADLSSVEIDVAPQGWKLTGPAAEKTALSLSDEKREGKSPLAVDYRFKDDGSDYVFLEQSVPLTGAPKRAKIAIFGNGAGESLRVNLADSSGELFQAYVARVDWQGWKDIDVPLDFSTHWGGNENGKMDAPVAFHSLVVNSEKTQSRWASRLLAAKLDILCESKEAALAPLSRGRPTTITVDDFERANPMNTYQTWKGDNSSIELVSSAEYAKSGNFALQVSYTLSTTRSEPSWVSVSLTPERPLKWTGAAKFTLWVKGDGTHNFFQISFVDNARQVWTYKNAAALRDTSWTQIEAPLSAFEPAGEGGEGKTMDLSKVGKFELSVVGEQSVVTSGKFWIDEFQLSGTDLNPAVAAPRAVVTQDMIDKAKVSLGDDVHFEWRQTPEFGRELKYYNRAIVSGTSKNLAVTAHLVSAEAEAGTSQPFQKPSSAAPPIQPVERKAAIELAYINASLQKVHPNLSVLSVGNLYVDYGRDVFAPLFGFKGVQAEGQFAYEHLPINYNTFYIKHVYDAYTFGARLQAKVQGAQVRTMTVSYNDTAKDLNKSEVVGGYIRVISNSSTLTTRPIGADDVYFADINRVFFDDRLDLTAAYGMNRFNQDHIKNVTSVVAPQVSDKVFTPVSAQGRMAEAKIRVLKIPWPETKLIADYRRYGTHFRPFYRADPFTYDYDNTDLRGWKLEGEQIVGRFKLNLFYDNVDRGARGTGYHRRIFKQSIGVYALNRWDVVLSHNHRKELYALNDPLRSEVVIVASDPKNEDSHFYEFFLGHWFSEAFKVWGKFMFEDLELVTTKTKLRKDIFVVQGDVAIQENAKVSLNFSNTRYDQKAFDRIATDSTNQVRTDQNLQGDNRLLVSLDIHF